MKDGLSILILILLFSFAGKIESQEKNKVPIPGIYNTGVDDNRMPLADGEADPHYMLSVSADVSFPGPDAWVVASEGYLMDCCWIRNDNNSKWIAPRTDAIGTNATGLYFYSLSFSLQGFKLETAEIKGYWTSDNNGVDIMINNQTSGFTTPYTAFNLGFYPFEIKEGFTGGTNTISFVVYNGEAPTGLRVVIYGEAEPIEYVNK